MSNGISAEGTRQTKTPLTGERVVAVLKSGEVVRGMYQDGRIYAKNRKTYLFDEVEGWREDVTVTPKSWME